MRLTFHNFCTAGLNARFDLEYVFWNQLVASSSDDNVTPEIISKFLPALVKQAVDHISRNGGDTQFLESVLLKSPPLLRLGVSTRIRYCAMVRRSLGAVLYNRSVQVLRSEGDRLGTLHRIFLV